MLVSSPLLDGRIVVLCEEHSGVVYNHVMFAVLFTLFSTCAYLMSCLLFILYNTCCSGIQVLFCHLPLSVTEGKVTAFHTCKCVTKCDHYCQVILMEISRDVKDQKFIFKFMAVKSSSRRSGRH